MDLFFWRWLILGFVLTAFGIWRPGTFLLCPGLAAFLTGILAYMAPSLGLQAHAPAFAGLTLAAIWVGRKIHRRLDG